MVVPISGKPRKIDTSLYLCIPKNIAEQFDINENSFIILDLKIIFNGADKKEV